MAKAAVKTSSKAKVVKQVAAKKTAKPVAKKKAAPKKSDCCETQCCDSESCEPPMGSICHIEIPAPDLAKAAKFYSKVFGWKVDLEPGITDYAMFDDGVVCGGFDPAAKVSKEHGINLVLSTKDIPAKLKEIKAAGGSIVKEKAALPGNYGFVGYFKDPNGNQLCIWSKD